MKDKFLWLSDAGVVHPVYNITEPKAPLKINEKRNLFKLFLSDTGLLTSYYSDSVRLGILSNDSSFNNGGLYENVVVQELCANGYSDLWYYNNKVLGELDFVIEQDNNVLPIEVKSGKNYFLHSALNNVLSVNDYHINEAIVLNNGNLRVDGKIIYMPIYMLIFFKRNPSGEIKYHLDLDVIYKREFEIFSVK